MKRSTGALGGVVLLLFALLIAGCGGSTSAEPLSKSEFLKQGNAICAKGTKAREEAVREIVNNHDRKASRQELRKQAVDKIVSIYEGTVEQIADLGAPKGEEAKVEALVDTMEEAVAQARAHPGSIFVARTSPFLKANKAAETYGLDHCIG